MNVIPSLEIQFYQNLGKLFYAIAASDKIVRKAEVDTLINLVKSKWAPIDNFEDEFQADAAYQIETVFNYLNLEGEQNAESYFEEFKSFKKAHESLFTKTRKLQIWKTSNKIANSFSGKNKSEIIMLARLKMILEK